MSCIPLPSPPSTWKSCETIIHEGTGGFPYTIQVEWAGRALHHRVRNIARGRSASCESLDEDKKILSENKKKESDILNKYRESIKGKDFLKLSIYEQLGITEYGFSVTEDQVKKAYHRVLIEHHPDKTGKDQSDPNYLAVQKAFTILMDPKKKRAYDSQCNFDEWIPTGNEIIKQNSKDNKGKCFYELYGNVFKENARFSVIQPVPLLGDDNTDLDRVTEFYNFWFKFESWRDFTHDAEHDVDSADHRDEKRYLMKKNELVAKKKKKIEYNRLADLVDRARINDPRLRRIKEKSKKKKLNEQKAKEQEKQRILDEQKAKEEELAKKKEQEEELRKQAKVIKDKEKKLLRKCKKLFKELMIHAKNNNIEGSLNEDESIKFCDHLSDTNKFQSLNESLGGSIENFKKEGLKQVQEIFKSIS